MKFSAKIDRFVKDSPIKAIASVTLDGMFVVKNLRVVDGAKGCFVAMPQETYQDKQGKTCYRDTFFPMTPNARQALEAAVLSAYDYKEEFTVVNVPVFRMPATGGKSLVRIPLLILLCVGTCAGLLLYRKKRRHV